MRNIQYLMISLLITCSTSAQTWNQKGSDIIGQAPGDQCGFSVSMADANCIAIGSISHTGSGPYSGNVRVFRWNTTTGTWIQKGQDINGEASYDWSGRSVCMPDSNVVAIGAATNGGGGGASGHVRIYRWNGSSWVQMGLDINGEAPSDHSGWFVSMPDTNTIAIGARDNDGGGISAGHVRIFNWNGTAWIQKGTDIDGEAPYDQSGSSVSMPDSATVAIGAPGNDGNGSNNGHVRVFSWNSSIGWVQKGTDIDGDTIYDTFGSSVHMPDANTVAIGAPYYNYPNAGADAGLTRVYEWTGSNWVQRGLEIYGDSAGDHSGDFVYMPDVNTLTIGSPWNDVNGYRSGCVRVFSWNSSISTWQQKGLTIYGDSTTDYSGFSISMPDENTVGIGSMLNDENGSDAGKVRVFAFNNNVGILENSSGLSLTVYPNPASKQITINSENTISEIQIINPAGAILFEKSYADSKAVIDISKLCNGMYFVITKSSTNSYAYSKLVVLHD